MKAHFAMMARYNAWANARLYRMASQLPDEQYRRDVGAFFRSLHGTLNHLLTADQIWMHRLTGRGEHPARLDAIVFDDLSSLIVARREEDERIKNFVHGLGEKQLDIVQKYQTMNGTPMQQPLREILAHVFNHQTHHRGQAHAILTILGIGEPEPLDLLLMLREQS